MGRTWRSALLCSFLVVGAVAFSFGGPVADVVEEFSQCATPSCDIGCTSARTTGHGVCSGEVRNSCYGEAKCVGLEMVTACGDGTPGSMEYLRCGQCAYVGNQYTMLECAAASTLIMRRECNSDCSVCGASETISSADTCFAFGLLGAKAHFPTYDCDAFRAVTYASTGACEQQGTMVSRLDKEADRCRRAATPHVSFEKTVCHRHLRAVTWSYAGNASWPRNGYDACTGMLQSPVDIDSQAVGPIENPGSPILNAVRSVEAPAPPSLMFNGRDVAVQYDAKDTLGLVSSLFTEYFALQECSFHTRSMHTVDGAAFAAERICIFTDANKASLAVSTLYSDTQGEVDPYMTSVVQRLRMHNAPGRKFADGMPRLPLPFQSGELDHPQGFFFYPGSQPHPPCAEGLPWLVQVQPKRIVSGDWEVLREYAANNVRDVVPIGPRRKVRRIAFFRP